MLDSSGVQRSRGQALGQYLKPTRGGFERTKIGALGPTEVAGNHHQRVVFGTDLLVQGVCLPCSWVWSGGEAQRKMAKIKQMLELKDEVVESK